MIAVPLSAAADAQLFGGKAAQLGAAIRAGLPVPGGFGLHYDLVESIVRKEDGACAEVDRICNALPNALAVRSSAIGEDSAAASFAGQHATLLNVKGYDATIAAVEAVWQSARTESAMAYRARVGADMAVRVGVVIQQLVDADVAGVLFTRNPVTGADELVIEAAWGLGEAIVQGLVIPDRFRIGRAGDVLERVAGYKDLAVRRDPNGATRQERVGPDLAERPCLTTADLDALAALTVKCDEIFGPGPHDIEWALAGQTLYLLQLRPITNPL
ncbi:PEP/pyruvate-binding domain-containing protein [Defluviimonas aestuarii]|uniref:PEP/pyruvate-binding domain-containing protein n=1 Tax=Albidovulum aestuarii TaxID=1130726 RepID=UPI00249B44EF|nr:PEP/pyruvate-binding domain-containing protein [Defluviimonas aestuarii]MDI3338824.1 PEP/pyruvate-binding domain-containing protein [Defluviimonas aestuarii]